MALFDTGKLVKATDFADVCKGTVQITGKIGFSEGAANLMKLERGCALMLSELSEGGFAAVVVNSSECPDAFAVRKSGKYCSISMKGYFERHNIPYADRSIRIIYDIIATDERYDGRTVYRWTKRTRKRTTQEFDEEY